MKRILLSGILISLGASVFADTTDVSWKTEVVIGKEGTFCADDPNCFNRYHPEIQAVATASPGDFIVFETRDALDSDLRLDSNADDVAALDLSGVHPRPPVPDAALPPTSL